MSLLERLQSQESINFTDIIQKYIVLAQMTTTLNTSHFLIDQQNQVSRSFLTSKLESGEVSNIEQLDQIMSSRNKLKENARSQGSYQIILQQSLTTQDKPFLYEILIQNDPSIIRSSLEDLPPRSVIELLKMIRSLLQQHIKLGKGQDHCLSISLWLEYLIKLHLTTIVSNPQNKQAITAIRRFIQKKAQEKTRLEEIKSHLLTEQNARQLQSLNQQRPKKNPKFQYIEQEKQHVVHDEEQGNDDQDDQVKDQDMEGLQMDDLDMDDLLQDDF